MGKIIKNKLLDDYCVLDLETTGTNADLHEIIEVGIIKVKNHKITDTYSQLVKPRYSISYYITELTGISNEMVRNMPRISEIKNDILDFIGNDFIVGHNVNFDVKFLNNNLNTNIDTYADTLSFCRKLFPNDPRSVPKIESIKLISALESHSLLEMAKYLGLTHSIHRALGDCITTYELYEAIRNKIINEGIDLKKLFAPKKSKSKC